MKHDTLNTKEETMKTNELQDKLTAALTEAGFPGKWWGPNGGPATRFYFGKSTEIKKAGKPVRGIKVWIEFDNSATLEGAALRAVAKKCWHQQAMADWHARAAIIAIGMADPERAARLQAEIDAAREADEPVGDLVEGEQEELARTA